MNIAGHPRVTWRGAAKLAFSALLVGWLLSRTPIAGIRDALSGLDPAALWWGAALSLAAWWISAVRLWLLAFEFRLRDVILMTFVGLYYGTVMPGQVAGDVIKAYRLSHAQSAPGRAAAATFIDRVLSVLALFMIGGFAAPWMPQAPSALTVALAVVSMSIAVGVGMLMHPRLSAALAERLTGGQTEGFRALPGRFVQGLGDVVKHRGRVLANFAVAFAFHAFCIAIHVVVAPSLGIDLPVAAWCLVYAAVSVLVLLPITVAGLGLREGGYVGLLGLFGIAASQAFSLSLVFFAYALLGALIGFLVELATRPPTSAASQ